MPYLIDGHNLIPKLGLRLESLDDEMELIAILQEFCRTPASAGTAPSPHILCGREAPPMKRSVSA